MKRNIAIVVFCCLCQCAYSQTGWFDLETKPKPDVDYTSFFFHDSLSGYVITNHPYYTSDGGKSWSEVDLPKEIVSIRRISFVSRKFGIAGGTIDFPYRVVILRTVDSGLTWQRMDVDSLGQIRSAIQLVDSLYGYAATAYAFDSLGTDVDGLYVLKTSDGGITWDGIQIVPEGSIVHHSDGLAFKNRDTGMVLVRANFPNYNPSIRRTFDGGKSWEVVGPPLDSLIMDPDPFGGFSSICWVRNQTWLATHGTGLFRTTDNGDTWLRITPFYTRAVSCYDGNICLCYFGTNRDRDGYIYKSIDAGETWFPQHKTSKGIVSTFIVNERIAYAGGFSGTLLKTIDGGGPPLSVADLKSCDCNLTVSPNPATDYTTISFETNSEALYCEVFDALGRKIYQVTIQPNTTSHTIDVREFASGMYFVRLGGKSLKFLKH